MGVAESTGEMTLEAYLDRAVDAWTRGGDATTTTTTTTTGDGGRDGTAVEDAVGALVRDEASVVRAMARACAKIGRVVRRAGLSDVRDMVEGKNGSVNVHGEEQAALDEAAHDACVEALTRDGRCAWIASEESEEIVRGNPEGRLACVFDPLDGSSNIECGVGVGTIFGVVDVAAGAPAAAVYERPGGDMRSVGYVLYGASTILVLSFVSANAPGGVCAFTYDDARDAFVLTKENVKIPESGGVYSVNQANQDKWDAGTRAYIDECVATKTLRYIGSMVADVHRTLLYGGTFHYPADARNGGKGKLRAVYECFPMATVIERAGGMAICGADTRVLDFVPTTVHARCPIHLGSARDVERLSRTLAAAAAAERSTYFNN